MALLSYKNFLPPEIVLPDEIITRPLGDARYLGINGTAVNSNMLGNKTLAQVQEYTTKAPRHLGTTNLNTVQDPGVYYQSANANTPGNNYPVGSAGSLSVWKAAGVIQEYRVYNTSKVYRRALYTGTSWTSWALTYDTQNKPSKSDVGLSNVLNYGFTTSVSDSSTTKYASASAVKTAYDLAATKISKTDADLLYLAKSGKAADSSKLNGYTQSTAATASTIAMRDGSADIACRLLRPNYANQSTIDAGSAIAFRVNNGSNNFVRFCSNMTAIRSHIGLGNVNNWVATSSTTDGSSTKYATAAAVKNLQDQVNTKVTNNGTCGTIYATNSLRVKGTSQFYFQDYGGGLQMTDTTYVRVTNSKKLYVANEIVATGNVWAYYSDERLKTDVKPIENATDILMQWNGVHYRANDLAQSFGYDPERMEIGLLAGDLKATTPELVDIAPFDRDENGQSLSGENYMTVDYARGVAVLVEGFKEQKLRADRLEAEMQVLRQQLAQLLPPAED